MFPPPLPPDRNLPRRGPSPTFVILAVVVVLVLAGVAAAIGFYWESRGPGSPAIPPSSPPPNDRSGSCRGSAACFSDTVANIVDGDTLDVGSTRIRLALVNSPEVGQPGASAATAFTAATCPVGSTALVDQDDGQLAGSYGRMVALVWCGGTDLNEALLGSGNAALVSYYCSVSEFADEPWTGCP
ncbi:MAG: thermonuclease family protein [Thermoplasmata archaeon]|nr:thermonuclease family protein [Thermoplasmata archaeon]